ncbi:MAG: redox-sensing transcriptional repressor Rex [Ruminococcus sp.]|nr:redox-sensing transcriptional repressor Rex [Ruminococcus sp.]MCM1380632.1 redox-sensing transcriptional repressor Rex [Muribaculaceae bacterium]MCM1478374.1 redox-sensing transcriptional repressor Rex [Muribaculaceae bacterium]
MDGKSTLKSVPRAALARYPEYLDYLREQKYGGREVVSAAELAEKFAEDGADPAAELAYIGAKQGLEKYNVNVLIALLNKFLERGNVSDAVIVGAGQLGKTLLAFDGFSEYGLNIVAGFDISPAAIGTQVKGKQIFSVEKMKNLCERLNIHIGIITVPAQNAQQAADLLVKCGIKAIWNFSQVELELPGEIVVREENLAASLAELSGKLSNMLDLEDE